MNTVELGNLSSVVSKGTTPTTLGHAFAVSGIPFLRAEDLVDGEVRANKAEYFIPKETHALLSRSQLKPGDLLITIAGTLGRVAYIPKDSPPMNCNQAVAFARLDPSLADIKYLYLICQSSDLIKTLVDLKKVGTIGNLNLEQVRELKIPLPPLPEQKRIAAILDKADRLRRGCRFAQTLSDSFLQSVFIKMFGDPVANPMDWKKCTVGDEIDAMQFGPRFYNELYSPTGVRIIRITDLDNFGELDFLSMPRLKVSDEDKKTYALKTGELIFAPSGATVGKTALIPENAPVCIASAYFMTMRFKKTINPVFVRHLFAAKPIQSIIESRSRQSAQQNFSGPGLRELPLVVPPFPLQEKFAAIVQKFERIRRHGREATRQAEHLFQTLLHRAFRGEI